MKTETESAWSLVASVRDRTPVGPDGVDERSRTKHFRPGAKVYVVGWYPGLCRSVVVVGFHRGSPRMCRMVIDVKFLENLRVKVVYHPHVVTALLSEPPYPNRRGTEDEAREMLAFVSAWMKKCE